MDKTVPISNKLLKPICSTIIFGFGLLLGLVVHAKTEYSFLSKIELIIASSLLFYLSQLNFLRLFNKTVSR